VNINYRQLFPLGKAYGKAFCNREKEPDDFYQVINPLLYAVLKGAGD
jgi:hypothetical protein